MKSTITADDSPKPPEYPCVMQSTKVKDLFVLFLRPQYGVTLSNEATYGFGYLSDCWREDGWQPASFSLHPEKPEPAVVYPCLMRLKEDPNRVVLFTEAGAGVVVAGGTSLRPVGTYSNSWAVPRSWERLPGSVTLENS